MVHICSCTQFFTTFTSSLNVFGIRTGCQNVGVCKKVFLRKTKLYKNRRFKEFNRNLERTQLSLHHQLYTEVSKLVSSPRA